MSTVEVKVPDIGDFKEVEIIEVMVKVGDIVGPDDVVARTHLPGAVVPLNVANKLGIPPEDLELVMQKKIGDLQRQHERRDEPRAFSDQTPAWPSLCEHDRGVLLFPLADDLLALG